MTATAFICPHGDKVKNNGLFKILRKKAALYVPADAEGNSTVFGKEH